MKCLKCNVDMKCYNDVVCSTDRIDFVKCPNCNAKADIIFDPYSNEIIEVNWRRGDKK